jgi:hypothetical protein
MRVFEEVTLSWNGQDYKIPPDQVLRTIAEIEGVITMGDLAQMSLGRPMLAKLAMAFGIALRAAGAIVTDDEIYFGVFGDKTDRVKTIRERAHRAIFSLQSLMIPPEHLRAEPGKKPEAAGKRAASSPRRTSS